VAENPAVISNLLYYPPGGPKTALNLGYQAGCTNATIEGNYASNDTLFVDCPPTRMVGNTFYGNVQGISQTQYPDNSYVTQRPSGAHVVVRPNLYEPGRGTIVVFGWDLASGVSADVASVLAVGSTYEVRNAQDFFGPAIASGTYFGGSIPLPMTGLSVAAPVGWPAPPPTGPEFNVFVLLTTGSARANPARVPEGPAKPRLVERPTP
jgi:hypothetical protein